jgi:hypothetical protein
MGLHSLEADTHVGDNGQKHQRHKDSLRLEVKDLLEDGAENGQATPEESNTEGEGGLIGVIFDSDDLRCQISSCFDDVAFVLLKLNIRDAARCQIFQTVLSVGAVPDGSLDMLGGQVIGRLLDAIAGTRHG